MKVLFLSTFDNTGGAAIAASRLMHALQQYGGDVEVSMLCRKNIGWGPKFLRKQSWTSILERGIIWAFNGFSLNNLWATDIALLGQNITKTKEYQEADVIHLHWINQGFISLGTIEKMIRDGKRIVWTMHDEWPLDSIYHYTSEKENKFLWLARKIVAKKRSILSSHKITFVTCSRWLEDIARSKPLGGDQKIISIPNTIDTTIFKPVPHTNRQKVLFVSQKITDERKGIKYLDEAAAILGKDIDIKALGRDIPYIDKVKDMSALYALYDAFVTPSLQDNLPNTIMEAMACGTPCVGFDVGGIPEMIDHLENGYVAKYRDAEDLAAGIRYVLDESNHERLSRACREKVKRCYNGIVVTKMYLQAYQNLCAPSRCSM